MPDQPQRKPLDVRFLMSSVILIFTIGVTWGSMVWMVRANAAHDGKQDDQIEKIDEEMDEHQESIIEMRGDVTHIKDDVEEMVQTQQILTLQQQEQKILSVEILAQLKRMNGS